MDLTEEQLEKVGRKEQLEAELQQLLAPPPEPSISTAEHLPEPTEDLQAEGAEDVAAVQSDGGAPKPAEESAVAESDVATTEATADAPVVQPDDVAPETAEAAETTDAAAKTAETSAAKARWLERLKKKAADKVEVVAVQPDAAAVDSTKDAPAGRPDVSAAEPVDDAPATQCDGSAAETGEAAKVQHEPQPAQDPAAEKPAEVAQPGNTVPGAAPAKSAGPQMDVRVRTLRKKLAQIATIEQKLQDGHELTEEQIGKVARKAELEAELADVLDPKAAVEKAAAEKAAAEKLAAEKDAAEKADAEKAAAEKAAAEKAAAKRAAAEKAAAEKAAAEKDAAEKATAERAAAEKAAAEKAAAEKATAQKAAAEVAAEKTSKTAEIAAKTCETAAAAKSAKATKSAKAEAKTAEIALAETAETAKPIAETAAKSVEVPAKPAGSQIDSRVRTLRKKLAQIAILEQRLEEGDELTEEQTGKVERKAELEAELAEVLKPQAPEVAEPEAPKPKPKSKKGDTPAASPKLLSPATVLRSPPKAKFVAKEDDIPVFESMESDNIIRHLKRGDVVVAAGPPKDVEGYMMLQIEPQGAVQKDFLADAQALLLPLSSPTVDTDVEALRFGMRSPSVGGTRSPNLMLLRSPSSRWQDDPVSVEDIAPTPMAPKVVGPVYEFIENIQPFGVQTQASDRLKSLMPQVSFLSNDAFEEDALAMVTKRSGWRMTLMACPEGFEDASRLPLDGFCLDDSDGLSPSLIGFLVYRLRPELDCLSIAKLAIVPEHRGQGHGRTFIDWCIKYAKKQSSIAFISLSSLPEAVKFYQHIGFRAVDVKLACECGPDEDLVEGQVYMEYRLKGRSAGRKKARK